MSKINIICILLTNIVYSLSQQSTPWQVYYNIKSTPRGTLWRQKVRHNIKKYCIMSKMHNFRNKAIRGGPSVVPKCGPQAWSPNMASKCGPQMLSPCVIPKHFPQMWVPKCGPQVLAKWSSPTPPPTSPPCIHVLHHGGHTETQTHKLSDCNKLALQAKSHTWHIHICAYFSELSKAFDDAT